MILPGHLAVASLTGQLLRADRRIVVAVTMFPDLVDKPIRWLLRLTPNDRVPAHTALGWAITSGIVYRLCGRRVAWGWCVAYGSHLLCDELNAHLNPGRIYFWWPLKRYTMHVGPTGLHSSLGDFTPVSLLIEGLAVIVALWAWLGKGTCR